MSDPHPVPHAPQGAGEHAHEKKAWYYDPTWIIAIIAILLIGGAAIGYFTKGDTSKTPPVTATPGAEPTVVPRGPIGSSQPNVISVPNQPTTGGAEIIVTAPKDYNVKVEVTEW